MQNQENRTRVEDLQSNLTKTENEVKRLQKNFSSSREVAENHKTETERLNAIMEEMKAKHEADLARARTREAGLEREKSDLREQLLMEKKRMGYSARSLRQMASRERLGSPSTLSPADSRRRSTNRRGSTANDDDDVFGRIGGAKRRGPGFGPEGDVNSPSSLYASDFGDASPDTSLTKSEQRNQSPLALPNFNELEDLREELVKKDEEITELLLELERIRMAAGAPSEFADALQPSTSESPVAFAKSRLSQLGRARVVSRGVRGRRARGGMRQPSGLGRPSSFDSPDSSPGNTPSPSAQGVHIETYTNDSPRSDTSTPSRPGKSPLSEQFTPDTRLDRLRGSSDTPESISLARRLISHPSQASQLSRPDSFAVNMDNLGHELAALADDGEEEEDEEVQTAAVKPTYTDVGTMTDPVEPAVQNRNMLDSDVQSINPVMPVSTRNLAALMAVTQTTPRADRFTRNPVHARAPSPTSTIGPRTDLDDETDYESARSVVTVMPSDSQNGMTSGDDFHSLAPDSSADDDSDQESIRASGRRSLMPGSAHNLRVLNAQTPVREVIREVIKEVPVIQEIEVIKEVPVDREVIREVEKIVEVVKEVPVEIEREVIKEIQVDRPIEVIKEIIVDRPVEIIKEIEVTKEVFVDRPVEVIKEVEKIVEIEKIVDRPVEVVKEVFVDRPVEVTKEIEVIREVEKIVEIEKIVDRPVEVIKEIEKIVDRPVEVIKEVEVIREVFVDRPVEVIKEVEKIVDRPVEVIKEIFVDRPVDVIREVEKIVDRPVEVIREVPVDKIIEKEVIRHIEVPVNVIEYVDRIVEVPFDRVVERIVEKEIPVEKIVEREVVREVPVETIK